LFQAIQHQVRWWWPHTDIPSCRSSDTKTPRWWSPHITTPSFRSPRTKSPSCRSHAHRLLGDDHLTSRLHLSSTQLSIISHKDNRVMITPHQNSERSITSHKDSHLSITSHRLPDDDHLTSRLKLSITQLSITFHKDSEGMINSHRTFQLKNVHAAVWYHSDKPSLHQCDITPTMTPIFAAAWYYLDIKSHPCRRVISVPAVGEYHSDIKIFYILHTVVPANNRHACLHAKIVRSWGRYTCPYFKGSDFL